MHKLTTELSGEVIFEGTQIECERVLEAFKKYGAGERKFIIIPPEKWMSEDLRANVEQLIIDYQDDHMFNDGAGRDIITFGATFIGISNMSDDELLDELSEYCDGMWDEDDDCYKYHAEAISQKEIHKILTE